MWRAEKKDAHHMAELRQSEYIQKDISTSSPSVDSKQMNSTKQSLFTSFNVRPGSSQRGDPTYERDCCPSILNPEPPQPNAIREPQNGQE